MIWCPVRVLSSVVSALSVRQVVLSELTHCLNGLNVANYGRNRCSFWRREESLPLRASMSARMYYRTYYRTYPRRYPPTYPQTYPQTCPQTCPRHTPNVFWHVAAQIINTFNFSIYLYLKVERKFHARTPGHISRRTTGRTTGHATGCITGRTPGRTIGRIAPKRL